MPYNRDLFINKFGNHFASFDGVEQGICLANAIEEFWDANTLAHFDAIFVHKDYINHRYFRITWIQSGGFGKKTMKYLLNKEDVIQMIESDDDF